MQRFEKMIGKIEAGSQAIAFTRTGHTLELRYNGATQRVDLNYEKDAEAETINFDDLRLKIKGVLVMDAPNRPSFQVELLDAAA